MTIEIKVFSVGDTAYMYEAWKNGRQLPECEMVYGTPDQAFLKAKEAIHTVELPAEISWKIRLKQLFEHLEKNAPPPPPITTDEWIGWNNRHNTPLPNTECKVQILVIENMNIQVLTGVWEPKLDQDSGDHIGTVYVDGGDFLGTMYVGKGVGSTGYNVFKKYDGAFVYYNILQ